MPTAQPPCKRTRTSSSDTRSWRARIRDIQNDMMTVRRQESSSLVCYIQQIFPQRTPSNMDLRTLTWFALIILFNALAELWYITSSDRQSTFIRRKHWKLTPRRKEQFRTGKPRYRWWNTTNSYSTFRWKRRGSSTRRCWRSGSRKFDRYTTVKREWLSIRPRSGSKHWSWRVDIIRTINDKIITICSMFTERYISLRKNTFFDTTIWSIVADILIHEQKRSHVLSQYCPSENMAHSLYSYFC